VKRFAPVLLVAAFVLSLLFVPFRHRTLVRTPGGGFDFLEERVWAPLWDQPTFSAGVAEYPFRWILGSWAVLAVAGLALVVLGRRGKGGTGGGT